MLFVLTDDKSQVCRNPSFWVILWGVTCTHFAADTRWSAEMETAPAKFKFAVCLWDLQKITLHLGLSSLTGV
jgi:hypothetical protein